MTRHRCQPEPDQIRFWLREAREAADLIDLAAAFPDLAALVVSERPMLAVALAGDRANLELELAREQIQGKEADRDYWRPLQRQLEQLRHDERRS